MTKKLFGLLFLAICINNLQGQNQNLISNDEICDIPPNVLKVEYVDNFKDTLKLSIDLEEVYVGKKTKKVEFSYSENFSTESSLIKVTKDFAMRISVARVIDNGKKCYLYKIHIFEKYKDCWYDRNANGTWSIGKIGTINWGYYYGTKGTKNCFGYAGDITIE